MDCLKSEGAQIPADSDLKIKVENLANGLRESNPLSAKMITLLNQSAIQLCSGAHDQAKTYFD